jgi:excisionase family DNA binding protein
MSAEKRIEDILPRDNATRTDPSPRVDPSPRTAEKRSDGAAGVGGGAHSSGASGLPNGGGPRTHGSDPAGDASRARELESQRAADASRTRVDADAKRTPRDTSRVEELDILDIDQAAELLGVSIKTFNKVLHAQNMPARKIGREWKFSRQALIDWVGSGRSRDFYREAPDADDRDVDDDERHVEIKPPSAPLAEKPKSRRTAGWQIEMD